MSKRGEISSLSTGFAHTKASSGLCNYVNFSSFIIYYVIYISEQIQMYNGFNF